jgi:hypothetical protein
MKTMKTMLQKIEEANATDYRFERVGNINKREKLAWIGVVAIYDGWQRYHLKTINSNEYGWSLDVFEINHKDGAKTMSVAISNNYFRRYLRQNIPYTNNLDSLAIETLKDWNNIRG